MTKHFQNEIDRIKQRFLHLTALVEESLLSAVKAVQNLDSPLAKEVVIGDEKIDQNEVELEEDFLKILALYQPVAIDLRFIIAALKINNDLERIADLAVNIAQEAVRLSRLPKVSIPFDLPRMLDRTVSMVHQSADSLVDLNAVLAYEVCNADDELDDLNRQARKAVVKKLQSSPQHASSLISQLAIASNLERIGDHATNIAEDVIYMIDGEIVRHRLAEEE
jgi:phosphate transport system protein